MKRTLATLAILGSLTACNGLAKGPHTIAFKWQLDTQKSVNCPTEANAAMAKQFPTATVVVASDSAATFRMAYWQDYVVDCAVKENKILCARALNPQALMAFAVDGDAYKAALTFTDATGTCAFDSEGSF